MLFLFLSMEWKVLTDQLIRSLQTAPVHEYMAVVSGIASVWLAKKANIWVYPVGLINTVIFIYISLEAHLPGEAALNAYYTVVSLIGWYRWQKKDVVSKQPVLKITRSTGRERLMQFTFFAILTGSLFLLILFFKNAFFKGAIPWADALASAAGFTAMWLMTGKKQECWHWWILTNLVSVPLFFHKGYPLSAVYYLVLLVLAVGGLREWKRQSDS